MLLYNYRLLYIPYARNSSNSLAAYLYRDKVKRLVRTTRPSRAAAPLTRITIRRSKPPST